MLKAIEKDRSDFQVQFRGLGFHLIRTRSMLIWYIILRWECQVADSNPTIFGSNRYIINVICKGGVEWTMMANDLHHEHFPLNCLSAEGLACFKFVSSRLLSCHRIGAVLVYAIITGVPIDVGMFIFGWPIYCSCSSAATTSCSRWLVFC